MGTRSNAGSGGRRLALPTVVVVVIVCGMPAFAVCGASGQTEAWGGASGGSDGGGV